MKQKKYETKYADSVRVGFGQSQSLTCIGSSGMTGNGPKVDSGTAHDMILTERQSVSHCWRVT